MIFNQSDSPAHQSAAAAHSISGEPSKQDEVRQCIVLKRHRSWHVKWRGRFSAPYKSQAKAIRDAISYAEQSCMSGKPAMVAVFTRESGLKTIWTFDRKIEPVAAAI